MSRVINDEILYWLARNKYLGVTDDLLLEHLVQGGCQECDARRALTEMKAHPYFRAAEVFADKLRRREAMMDIQRTLCPPTPPPETHPRLSPETFLSDFYGKNRPVILSEQVRHWAVMQRWSPAYFKEHHGALEITAQLRRETNADYHLQPEAHFSRLSMGQFVDRVLARPHSNDSYLVLSLADLLADGLDLYPQLDPLPGILDRTSRGDINFWFGPGDTVTRLHFDLKNLLLVQIYGRKRVWLVPPCHSHLLYDEHPIYSPVDAEHPDLERHPLFRHADIFTVDLEPGQALFLPVGWWHQVRSLEISISLNFGNFVVPNKYHW